MMGNISNMVRNPIRIKIRRVIKRRGNLKTKERERKKYKKIINTTKKDDDKRYCSNCEKNDHIDDKFWKLHLKILYQYKKKKN